MSSGDEVGRPDVPGPAGRVYWPIVNDDAKPQWTRATPPIVYIAVSVFSVASNLISERDRELNLLDTMNHVVVLENHMSPPVLRQDYRASQPVNRLPDHCHRPLHLQP